MNNELEKRLREMVNDRPIWPKIRMEWDLILAAARIGAEIEREECALLMEDRARDRANEGSYANRHGQDSTGLRGANREAALAAAAIRARGAK